MEGKLLIAKYKDKIIHISQYQETEHHGKLLCPFCNPKIRVTHNVKGFFMAWRDEGGHNCRGINVNYFDAEWEGKDYVEIVDNKNGNIDVTIDINEIAIPRKKKNTDTGSIENIDIPTDSNLEFPDYKQKEKVFRDVIRSVYQMKRLIEKNDYNALKTLNFLFKVDKNECLSFNEVVYRCNEVEKAPNYKKRFFIFQVDRVVQSKGTTYINSYIMDGRQLAGVLDFPYNINSLKKKYEGQYVIAYGQLKRSKTENGKGYLDITNDFHMVKLNDDEVKHLFNDVQKERFVYTPKKESEDMNTEIKSSIPKAVVKNSDSFMKDEKPGSTNYLGQSIIEKTNMVPNQFISVTKDNDTNSLINGKYSNVNESEAIKQEKRDTIFKRVFRRILGK